MFVKICKNNSSVIELDEVLYSFELEVNQIPEFIKQLRNYGIHWKNNDIAYLYSDSRFAYNPLSEIEHEKFYFKITVKEIR